MHLNILIQSYRNNCYQAEKSFNVGDLVVATDEMDTRVKLGYKGMITRKGDIGCEIIWFKPNTTEWCPYMAIEHMRRQSPHSRAKHGYELERKEK
jgi:hypothetical protein